MLFSIVALLSANLFNPYVAILDVAPLVFSLLVFSLLVLSLLVLSLLVVCLLNLSYHFCAKLARLSVLSPDTSNTLSKILAHSFGSDICLN